MKKAHIFSAFVVVLGMSFAGCGKNATPEDTIPPGKPILMPGADYLSTSDSLCGPFDQGAVASNGVKVMWELQSEPDLEEWRIFYRKAFSPDNPSEAIHAARLSGTDFVIRDPRILPDPMSDSTQNYEYWVKAVDQSGNYSAPSDTFRYELLRKTDGLVVTGNSTGRPIFAGQFLLQDLSRAPDRYSIKLRNANRKVIWRYSAQEYIHDFSIPFIPDSLLDPTVIQPDQSLINGSYEVSVEFWRLNSAGSVASYSFSVPVH